MESITAESAHAHAPDLEKLLAPKSVAVVGASQLDGRVNGAIRNLRELGFKGAIFPVNPKYSTVMDLPCYPNLRGIPDRVDLVVVGIPSRFVLSVLDEAHECGIEAAVIISSGFGEAGEDGKSLQADLARFIARTGMLVCGPNCVGAVNFHACAAGYYSASPKDCTTGDLAVVSQSGTIIVALVRGDRPAGFSYLVSSGNEVGLSSGDYISYFVRDPQTRVIGAFLEGINKPAQFLEAAEEAQRAGKPIVVMKTGRSELGSAASAAHTGSLAGSFEVQRAVFRQHGIVQCDDIDEWIEAIELFRRAPVPQAVGIGLVGVSGGENSLVLDQLSDNDLTVPPLSEVGTRTLSDVLPAFAHAANPIDTSGGLGDDPTIYVRCLEVLAAEPEIGIVIVSQDSPAFFDKLAAQAIVEVAARSDKCFIFLNNISRAVSPEVKSLLEAGGVPCLQGLRPGVKAIGAYVHYHLRERGIAPRPTLDASRRTGARALLSGQGRLVTEDVGKRLLAAYGIPTVEERVVTTPEQAVLAADETGYPAVAKVLSPDIAHKMAAGGVRLGLQGPDEVSKAIGQMEANVRAHTPEARIDGFSIQPMVRKGIELILGMKRDPDFGPVLLLGLGGSFVEILKAVAMRLPPISETEARAMVDEVPLLRELAERTAVGLDLPTVVVPLIVKFATLCAELDEDVEEIDINPLIVDPRSGRAVAVDALFVKRR